MAWDWDLTYLYKDFNDPAFAADLAELPELNKKLAAAVTADLPAKEKLEQIVKADDELSDKLARLFSFCQRSRSAKSGQADGAVQRCKPDGKRRDPLRRQH